MHIKQRKGNVYHLDNNDWINVITFMMKYWDQIYIIP
jgi:hypothetical protein